MADQLTEETKFILTMIRHRENIDQAVKSITKGLEDRASTHDLSKLTESEAEGFVRINKIAREYDYGTDEYEESLQEELGDNGSITEHYDNNDHHPDHFDNLENMGFMEIIEMVCDWYSANKTYDNGDFMESVEHHKDKYDFTDEQWWLIEQVANYLEANND
jgi:hypothetical protein